MNLRLSSLRAMSMHQGTGRLMAVAALAFALAGAGMGSAVAAPGDAASAPEGASVSYAAGSQYTVRPGQSLNDVAIAVTQSHDKGTLARASRALFDANPNAFMSHDPSRMRVGALLTIPALDATGAPAASAPVAGSASAAPSATTAAPASAPNAAAVGAAVGAASGVAQVNAAAASAASAAAQAAMPAVSGTASSTAEASSAMPGSSAAAGAAPVAGGSQAVPASGAHVWSGAIQPSASEAAEGASAAATAAATSTAQPASQPRAQVSSLQQLLALKNRVLMELQKHGIGGTPTAPVPPATNGAQPAAGVSSAAAVSGHGSAPISTSTDAGISQTNLSIAAAIGAALVVLLAALRLSRRKRVGVAAAGGSLAEDAAAASARAAGSQDVDSTREASDVSGEAAAGYAAAVAPAGHETAGDEAAAREVAERVAAEREAEIRAAAAREAAVREAAERESAERAAAERLAAERAEAERAAVESAEAERAEADQAAAARAAEDHDAAQRAAAEHEAAARQPHTGSPSQDHDAFQHASQEVHPTPAPFEATQSSPDTESIGHGGPTSEPLPSAHHENLDGATTAASLAAAAELGAEALPLTPLEPVDESFQQEVPPHRLQWDDEPASSAPAMPLAEPTNESRAESWSHQDTPPPVIDFTRQQAEPHTTSPFGQPHSETSAHPVPDTSVPAVPTAQQGAAHVEPTHQPSYEPQPQSHLHAEPATPDGAPNFEPAPVAPVQPALSVPTEFPRDALDAFSSLNMPLPPRVESTDDAAVSVPGSLATPPVASPETAAQQAVAPHDPDDFPHVADEIAAGTAGHAAVAGLGAAGFGALKLDFDLELPPSPAQPLPAFTRADLTRIARNKLDLAAEYIDLGDLSGARTLINEVIEANDPATRTEARALLSTLAPLS
ncbi:fimbrial protein FimV [Paraburkholderia madseniana]|uniref:Fimbrial protein FimV n=2 Tax=Paraburkholderia madseniana TaxID=2599607 RepID=A0A6N6WMT8_9BURK|nr:FimV/HubP family polar landmark protein [Paraburkholderia madseniana]KAE8761965.1 fimbrial protein FimV [Paraburkholderia madseniana]